MLDKTTIGEVGLGVGVGSAYPVPVLQVFPHRLEEPRGSVPFLYPRTEPAVL